MDEQKTENEAPETDAESVTEVEEIRDENRKARRAAASRRRASRERERQEAEAVGLDASEIVDDALQRSGSSLSKWLRNNRRPVEGVIVLGLLVWGGMVAKSWYDKKQNGVASDILARPIDDQLARIGEPEERNPLPSFPKAEDREKAVSEGYLAAVAVHPEHGTGAMAKLGRAAGLLDERKFDEAAELFRAVRAHPEVKHDAELTGKSIDGLAIALEGKGDIDGALAAYQDLEATGTKGFVALAQYQEARLLFGKGQKDKAKELLDKASTAVGPEDPMEMFAGGAPPRFLQVAIKRLKAQVSPGAVAPISDAFKQLGLNALSPEQLAAAKAMAKSKPPPEKATATPPMPLPEKPAPAPAPSAGH